MPLKTLLINSTHTDEKLILTLLNNYKDKNIFIFNYDKSSFNIKKLIKLSKDNKFNSIEIFNPNTKSSEEIIEKIKFFNDNNLVLFIGLEKLFISNSENIFEIKTKKIIFNYKSYDNIDFIKMMNFIDEIYNKTSTDLLFLITIENNDISKEVVNKIDSYDIQVISIVDRDNQDNDFEIVKSEILNAIKNQSYEDSMNILNKYINELSHYSIRKTKVIIWLQHGYSDKAIKFLKSNYNILEDDEKVNLADLYYHKEHYHESFNIAKSIFLDNPFTIDVLAVLLKSAIKNNQFENWYEKVLLVDSNDEKVLEVCTNYFIETKSFDKAIKFREKLFQITKNPIYLLLIETLKIQKDKPIDGSIAEKQLNDNLKDFKDDKFEIEKSYKLGLMWFQLYNSPYKAYYHFKNVLKICNNNYSVDSAKHRMKLLENQGYANKIIKVSYQKKYPDKLPKLRTNELLNSLLILTYDDKGYIIWQDFIDKSQNIDTWKTFLLPKVLENLKKLNIKKIQESIKKSSLLEMQKIDKIKALRVYKTHQLSQEQIKTIKDSIDSLIAMSENLEEHIWSRYLLAIFLIYQGEFQLANYHAISLWCLSSLNENEKLSKLSRLLGTLAWGISQFKIGKEIEGIASIIVTIEHFIDIEEVVPFIEDGLSVLNIWIQTNKSLLSKEDRDFFSDFYNELGTKNSEQNEIYKYLMNEDWQSIYDKLGYKVYNSNEYNSQWGVYFYYYIISTKNLKNINIDFDLIVNNYQNLIKVFSTRLDMRAKVLYSISEVLFSKKSEFMLIILELLTVAIKDLENNRKTLKNTYERSFISDENREIYRQYLFINILLYHTETYTKLNREELISNILNTFDYLSPRVLKEKKSDNLNKIDISEDLQKIEDEYLELSYNLTQFTSKNFSNAYMTDEYKNKSNRYMELKKILEKEHPYYKFDSIFEHIPIKVIQLKLENDEIYYQYIENKYGIVCYLVITKDFIYFNINYSQNFDKVNIKKLAKDLQEFDLSSKYNINEIHNTYYDVSKKYFKPLFEYSKQYKKIYINPDLSIPFLSSNLIRLKDKWLVEEVDFIVNVVNKNFFIEREENNKNNFAIATIGKDLDKQIKETKNWIDKNENRKNIFINNFEDNMSNIPNILKQNNNNSLLIVSHGIQGNYKNNLTGALSIEGQNKNYNINDLSDIFNNLNCVALLTCSSGSPSFNEYETSNSLFNKILSQNIQNIILCRWDVFLKPSLEIFDNLINLSKNKNIENSLNESIKILLNNKRWEHPAYWAGIEIWKN